MMALNLAETAARYHRFADEEARGKAPLYEALARGVAGDAETLRFLMSLPPAKRQPNLLFAAVRALHGTPKDWLDFRCRLLNSGMALGKAVVSIS